MADADVLLNEGHGHAIRADERWRICDGFKINFALYL